MLQCTYHIQKEIIKQLKPTTKTQLQLLETKGSYEHLQEDDAMVSPAPLLIFNFNIVLYTFKTTLLKTLI